MEILRSDKNSVAVYKESGIPSQPDKSGQPDMTALLKAELGGDIYCVHRLDTPTAGVMVYARSSRAAGMLSAALAADDSCKLYMAAVSGAPETDSGEMHDLLWHDRHMNKSFCVSSPRASAKPAFLEYQTLAKTDDSSLVLIKLHTGRTHQIRVQFASRKMPLFGDGKYGSRQKGALGLCCVRLCWKDPFGGDVIDICRLPQSPWNGFDITPDMLCF